MQSIVFFYLEKKKEKKSETTHAIWHITADTL